MPSKQDISAIIGYFRGGVDEATICAIMNIERNEIDRIIRIFKESN